MVYMRLKIEYGPVKQSDIIVFEKTNSNYITSQIEDLDYDLAISKDVLEHIINPEHAINEIWKKIKKGGFSI